MSHKQIGLSRCFLFALGFAVVAASAQAQSKVVISQVYGGGGNSGATYKNDFIELFNAGDQAQSLAGWSVQYASSTGSSWQVTPLTGSIQPGRYYLVQEAVGAGGTVDLPAAESTGSIPMSATTGKIALVSSTSALTGTCPSAIDFVGYGPANCSETATAPVLTNTTADLRAGQGCTDNNQNANDFSSGAPLPRNGASALNACLLISNLEVAEGDTGSTAFNFVAKLNINAPAIVTFNATTQNGSATASATEDYIALVSAPFSILAGQSTATVAVQINGDGVVEPAETFTVQLTSLSGAFPRTTPLTATGTIQNDDSSAINLSFSPLTLPGATEGVSYSQVLTVNNGTNCAFSSSGNLPPGLSFSFTGTSNTGTLSGVPTLSGSFGFSASASCSNGSTSQPYTVAVAFACETGVKTSTAIHTIQGTGATSPLVGQAVEVEGVVVGDFQSTANQLSGFYLQEPDATWDGDESTSEGIFIFDAGAGANVNVGDRVRVRGAVAEFSSSGSSITEIGSIQNKAVCSTGNLFSRTTLTLPIANVSDWERFEGMAVQFTQPLVVTGNFNLGAFGQIDLAPQVLYQPTQSPNASGWQSQLELNARSVLALDDGSVLANASLYPTLFPQGGLSASNTLRVGAKVNYDAATTTTAPLLGILDDRFGAYRIEPTAAVTFYSANPRPVDVSSILASVGGRFRVTSANVLNFFTTLGSRGAATATELANHKSKVTAALVGMNADIYGLSEVQNFSDGQTDNASNSYTNVAAQTIVDLLNAATSPGTFALVDTLGAGIANGTDAIRNVIIYKPSRVTPVGSPALYYQNDTNRPSVAQTFKPAFGAKADQQTFTVVVNHFRSKGSACGAGNDSVLQGNCNGLRLLMAQAVNTWLGTNPTGDPAGANRKYLLIGDFNAYYGEDPIQWFVSQNYTDLIAKILGPNAYSYNFGSQNGYLDHALANPALNPLIKSVAEWHINADEPAALQALDSSIKSPAAQAAYFAPDAFAASDHDPIIIGLNPLRGDLNDDGTVNAADQAIMTAAVGKSASSVDRRLDYDGDGAITLNDYRLWANSYREFLQ